MRATSYPVFCILCTLSILSPELRGAGLLIPVEPELPPLALLDHTVEVSIDAQVATTRVRQVFRNHTDRKLEATYVFPVPAGASVKEFFAWVDGKKVRAELLESSRAREVYESMIRQSRNPALLDYIGSDLLRVKIYPVPPRGDQTVELSFTSVLHREHQVAQYVYPLKTDRRPAHVLRDFSLTVQLKSEQPITNIYSPTHSIDIAQSDDRSAIVRLQQSDITLDRDFELFYGTSDKDIGLTAIWYRPIAEEDGYVMLLVSPRPQLSETQRVPRDMVFVVDTSGSMLHEGKIEQAKKALDGCLGGLTADDRFGLVSFASTVDRYRSQLVPATEDYVRDARRWVDGLYASGGTAIDAALKAALQMRSEDASRIFTIVFFTDGQPTVGETNVDRILENLQRRNSSGTRIFCFGVGHDLNAALLDQIAQQTRATTQYVRPGENLEAKVARFYDKIHHPVLANLALEASGVRLREMYPPELPDLFRGEQLIVLARYQGSGRGQLELQGTVGPHAQRFVYELDAPKSTAERAFVEQLWARRKVGYLLDQIRTGGEQPELVDEVVRLAKQYGIATPYTSYLIAPDVSQSLALSGGAGGSADARPPQPPAGASVPVDAFARDLKRRGGRLERAREAVQEEILESAADAASGTSAPAATAAPAARQLAEAKQRVEALRQAGQNLQAGDWRRNQVSAVGVELAIATGELKTQDRVAATAVRTAWGRRCLEIGGVWIDEQFAADTPTLVVRAQSDAYFALLQRQPKLREVFALGNRIVWIAPSGIALVIDPGAGATQLTDQQIERLLSSRAPAK